MQNTRDVLTPDNLTMLQVIAEAGSFAAAAAAFCWHCLATNQQRHRKEPCSLQPLGQGRRKGSQPCQ